MNQDRQRTAARSPDLNLAWSAALAMCGINYAPATDDDLAILDELSRHADRHVRETMVRALSGLGKEDPSRQNDAIDRILSLSLGEDKKLADAICDAFLYNRIPLDTLSEVQLDRLLDNLVGVPELDEYGINMVLNWAVKERPSAIIRFIKKRIARFLERRAARDWSYRIVPHQQNEIDLHGLQNSGELPELRATVLGQIEADKSARDEFNDLFWKITVFEEESFELLRPWFHSGDQSKFDLALSVLRHAPRRLAFSNPNLVLEVLEAAEKHGTKSLEGAIGLFVSGIDPYLFAGWAPEQPSATVDLRTSAETALANPQLHPLMRRLYEAIKAFASIDIRPFADGEDEEEF